MKIHRFRRELHMRYTFRSLLRPAAALALLVLASCGGHHGAGITSSALSPTCHWPVHGYQGAARSGSFAVVAVDDTEGRIDPLTAQLHLKVEPGAGGTQGHIYGGGLAGIEHAY